MKNLSYAVMIVLFAAAYLPVQAQDNTAALTQSITSLSGRLMVQYPQDWVASNAVKADIQLGFASEALTVAENETALNQANMRGGEGGNLILWALFPTLEVYPANPNPTDFTEVFNAIFQGHPDLERLEIADFPAARLNLIGESGLTLIGMGPAVLAGFTYARDAAGVDTINAIIESLHVTLFDEDTLLSASSINQPLATDDQRVTIYNGTGWYASRRDPVILTSPYLSPTQDFFANFMNQVSLEGPLFGIIAYSYAEFFEPEYTPAESDLRRGADQSLFQLQADRVGEDEALVVSGFPALGNTIRVGDYNSGRVVVVDAHHTLYAIFGIIPNEQLDEHADLMETVFSSVSIVPLPPEIAALPPEGLREGFRAPQFTTTMLDGSMLSLSDFQGKIVMLNFWATWCSPCRTEMPLMQEVFDTYEDQGFTILAINNAETVDAIQPYVDELGLHFPIALDPVGRIQQHFAIFQYPTSIFLDRQGVIYAVFSGPISREQLLEAVEIGFAQE